MLTNLFNTKLITTCIFALLLTACGGGSEDGSESSANNTPQNNNANNSVDSNTPTDNNTSTDDNTDGDTSGNDDTSTDDNTDGDTSGNDDTSTDDNTDDDASDNDDTSTDDNTDDDASDNDGTSTDDNDDNEQPTTSYTLSGTVEGLEGNGLVLQNNATDDVTITENGSFTFNTALADTSTYNISVASQPNNPSQECLVSNGASGSLAGANIDTIEITCSTNTYTVGGNVSGLAGTGLVLQNNAGNDLVITENGDFNFDTALEDDSNYNVSVLTQPSAPKQTCAVTSGATGVLSGNDISNITVTCSTNTYTIGGSVSGLTGSGLILQNNSEGDLSITADGSFTFNQALDDGSNYEISVLTQPNMPNQSCRITNSSGSLSGANVSDVNVSCENVFATTNAPVWQTTNQADNTSEFLTYTAFGSRSMHTIDIDQDSDLDIVSQDDAYNSNKYLQVFINNNQRFVAPISIPFPGGSADMSFSINHISVADIDSDMDKDIVAVGKAFDSDNDVFVWFENDGTTNFNNYTVIDPASTLISSVKIADIDNDDAIDIVVFSRTEGVVGWYRNEGAGVFSDRKVIDTRAPGETLPSFAERNVALYILNLSDLNGDDNVDVVLSSSVDTSVVWYQNLATGAFSEEQIIDDDISQVKDIIAGDINTDGNIDLLANSDGALQLFTNMSEGVFDQNELGSSEQIVLHDMDTDGDLDILTSNRGTSSGFTTINAAAIWYENVSNNDFVQHAVSLPENESILNVAAIDLNNDGSKDILWSSRRASSANGRAIEKLHLSHASYSIVENQTLIIEDELAVDPDGDNINYSLVDSIDSEHFALSINNGQPTLSFTAPPTSAPLDTNGDNIYKLWVSASDGVFTVNRQIWVTVNPGS